LKEQTTTIARNGRQMPVYIVGPDDDQAYPGLIVVHEIFGLNDHIRDVARRFAGENLRVFAPDLFEGAEGVPEDRNLDGMRKVWSQIPDAQLIEDMQSVFELAAARPDVLAEKIGCIGYCMGGAIAFMFACQTPASAWVIDYYGRVKYPELTQAKTKHPVDYAATISCPVLGLFSGCDALIPQSDIDLLEQSVAKRVDVEVRVYPDAPHAFFNDTREHYREDAAKDAWNLTMDFIRRHSEVGVRIAND
jgi:Dienelactone hydrolase and related enzymes